MWKIMHKRILNLSDLLDKKSFFLFGPRATGKTTLIDATLTNALVMDLLEARTFTSLLKDPGRLEEMIDDPS
jgi:predicted AAA+ superfamily ATPase